MTTQYQVILLGPWSEYRDDLVVKVKERIADLGLQSDSTQFIDELSFLSLYKSNSPSVCVYFGDTSSLPHQNIIAELQRDAVYLLPVVQNLWSYETKVPASLQRINGFELPNNSRLDELASRAMEALSLLRSTRRLFISYRRKESRSVAIQLYEHLDRCGFDVFLDTHSVRPGEPVQDELWHRLVDTDVVVLLDTPGFLGSRWTKEELAKASAMSIGVVQLIWPGHTQDPYTSLCFPFALNTGSFVSGKVVEDGALLTDACLDSVASAVESWRARSLAARQDNIIQEFTSAATSLGKTASLQPEKYITIQDSSGGLVMIIPTIGIPDSLAYNRTEDAMAAMLGSKPAAAFILFDHNNIREAWQNHLAWLDGYLPVKSIKIQDATGWLKAL